MNHNIYPKRFKVSYSAAKRVAFKDLQSEMN